MSKTMIEVKDLTCDYGHGRGVFHLSFAIEQGEVFGFLGPNGAGKTTTIRQLMGFVRPDSGTVRILGMDCFADASKIQKEVGYLPGELALMEDMSGIGFLRMMAGIRNMKDTSRMEELIQLFSLDAGQKIRRMSKGTKQKVGLVCALMHNPKILLLDEPTAGMDALSRRQMWNLLRKLNGKNLTILLTTHYMEEAQNLCSRVALMDHGKLEEVNTPAGLIDSLGNYTVDEFAGDETHSHYFHSREEAIAYLSGLSGQASLRETTLEDVFVERAGRHLMPS